MSYTILISELMDGLELALRLKKRGKTRPGTVRSEEKVAVRSDIVPPSR
jgi:hypothetical protein